MSEAKVETIPVNRLPVRRLARPRNATRSLRVLRVLQDEICSGRWPTGTNIPVEHELILGFGVGRTTIREAVSTLVHLGMLEPNRGQGTFIRSRTAIPTALADFTLGYEPADLERALRALEVEAARAAAERRTGQDVEALRLVCEGDRDADDFHALVLRIGGNPLLADMSRGLLTRMGRAAAGGPCPRTGDSRAEHLALVEAIADGDPGRAALAAAAHLG